ncbi:AAA family ATPase [Devosia sp. MC1541]|uniref:AAA family ATPase n=1 Tax=Devosia sp. MC1541 TaxID=2725264 RepID=UPI00145DAC5B|nr:AAA family ATPase [Devosia sp. MC1541]
MTFSELQGIDISNFRSIRGKVYAPLDAKVVLVHGENGAGKTSLLSAIELALTGQVDALRRADPNYELQILHKKASAGFSEVTIATGDVPQKYRVNFAGGKIQPSRILEADAAEFFGERAYLPQSLLGQLLQIYQDSGSDVSSPLARFVSKLLGLDRLDAIEAGLKPFSDVRNVRKAVERWSPVEIERSRLEAMLSDRRQAKSELDNTIREKCAALLSLLEDLGLAIIDRLVPEQGPFLDDDQRRLDESRLETITDQYRLLGSLRRDMSKDDGGRELEARLSGLLVTASSAYASWRQTNADVVTQLQSRVAQLFPQEVLPADLSEFASEGLRLLRAEQSHLQDRTKRAADDAKAASTAIEQLEVANRRMASVDQELSGLSADSGRLGALLAEISSFITDEICPVCGRDYADEDNGRLADHVHARSRNLSGSADRLVALGRSRSEIGASVQRLNEQIRDLESRQVSDAALAEIGRRAAAVSSALLALEATATALIDGQKFLDAEVTAQRNLSGAQQSNTRRLAIGQSLDELAISVGIHRLADETVEVFAERLDAAFDQERNRLEVRVRNRVAAEDLISAIKLAVEHASKVERDINDHKSHWERKGRALDRAQNLRSQAVQIRNTVDTVRSNIIRREFNERLNRLWRDLFVRLAPGEEFVPAFKIPQGETQRLQPKLYTPHRDLGDEIAGGTPGAMLSAGNLNTAALTLFVALHLSVPVQLPWLILDDPVQSMDDIHIAHFAALLRTLSKEHGRQIIIAVHDRQLFEYLRLELSPAFPEDSLITLEMTRSQDRDSQCFSTRYGFVEDTALRVA